MSDSENTSAYSMDLESPSPVLAKAKSKVTSKPAARAPLKPSNNNDVSRPVEEIYQKKTQLEHILLRPDTYIGSTEPITQPMWVYDELSEKLVERNITYVPGLYKIFDEILVNAADNKQRDASMNRIKVTINKEEGSITVENNGQGIPVVMHSEHKVYVPEMIFGQLLTSSNYDDSQEKVTGGRNGYGAKLANIFSTKFILETVDSKNGLKFQMQWSDNMSEKSAPKITKATTSDYTKVTFKPDFSRFHMEGLDTDIVSLMSKRVYDMAGCSHSSVKVYLNEKHIPVKNFKDYVDLYLGDSDSFKLHIVPHERWEVVVGISDGQFKQVSFVNSICTTKGGQHVAAIADQITKEVVRIVTKKQKDTTVKAHHVKNHLSIFVNCLIVNPAFDSQTKETLITNKSAFGSKPTLSEDVLKKIGKSELVERVMMWSKFKQNADLKKKGGAKKVKLTGIPKLDDANAAGSARSRDCTLILTEGDSAKALAISGLSVVGRDLYGVFPLKGKLLNVREASHSQHLKNEEIQNIVKILGLRYGHNYTDISTLRYGHVMIMADQDHDGSHIKGLLINFIHTFWPSLLKMKGFIQQFITPIVKVTKGNTSKTFFTIPEYHNWKSEVYNSSWKIKYYKGLGTSTAAEAKLYFSDLDTHVISFSWDELDGNLIDMAFSKKRADERKTWLNSYEEGTHVDYSAEIMNYGDFVNKELILFSMADNIRSIPSFVDGLKPAQRKVLYCCFKRNLKGEIKVAQLQGYVSEHSAYHHGEASLASTIIGMAQDFVGSNNINLLYPSGQYGTRILGGKDAASPRYIFTKLTAVARAIFHPDDDDILTYLDEDGQSIEPKYYMPVVPLVLINGTDGIGTGWSTGIPNYNPRDIIENIRRKLRGEEMEDLVPFYRGFNGAINPRAKGGFEVFGKIEQINDTTLRITELPIKKWTHDYKVFLEEMLAETSEKDKTPFIKDFKENHTTDCVDFTITLEPARMQEALALGLEKKFKMGTTIAVSNMHGFDRNGAIAKAESALDIMNIFYDIRMEYYGLRKASLIAKLEREWEKLDNKCRFILEVINGSLIVSNKKKDDLMTELRNKNFKSIFPETKKKQIQGGAEEDGDAASEDAGLSESGLDKGYDYLLSMKLWNLTKEKVDDLRRQLKNKEDELNILKGKSTADLWIEDLNALEVVLDDVDKQIANAKDVEYKQRKAAKKSKKYDSDEDDDWEAERKSKKAAASKPAAPKAVAAPKVVSTLPKKAASAPAVKAPAKTTKAPVVKSKATKKAKPEYELSDEEEDDFEGESDEASEEKEDSDVEILSLAERLASRMEVTPKPAKVEKKVVTKPVSNTQAAKVPAKVTKPKKVEVIDSDSEKEESVKEVIAPKSRATKNQKKIIIDDDSEEGEDDFSEEDDDDDFEFDDSPKKKKAAAIKKPVSKPKAEVASKPKADGANKKRSAPPSKPKVSKAAALSDSSFAVDSPGFISPEAKRMKVDKKPIKKTTNVAPKVVVEEVKKTPKPKRAATAKVVSYKVGDGDSDEEDEEESETFDDEDDESEFEEDE